MFKKTIILSGYLLALLFLPATSAWAETCSWQEGYIWTSEVEYLTCENHGQVSAPESSCSGAKQNTFDICCCTDKIDTAAIVEELKFNTPKLQVGIDKVKLSEVVCSMNELGEYVCPIPWLSQYISGIYNYAISIVGILAAIVLMAGGVLWLVSGGDSARISRAKELIIGSVSGLIILMASYLILFQINPNLVSLKSITISNVTDTEPRSDEHNPTNSTDCKYNRRNIQ